METIGMAQASYEYGIGAPVLDRRMKLVEYQYVLGISIGDDVPNVAIRARLDGAWSVYELCPQSGLGPSDLHAEEGRADGLAAGLREAFGALYARARASWRDEVPSDIAQNFEYPTKEEAAFFVKVLTCECVDDEDGPYSCSICGRTNLLFDPEIPDEPAFVVPAAPIALEAATDAALIAEVERRGHRVLRCGYENPEAVLRAVRAKVVLAAATADRTSALAGLHERDRMRCNDLSDEQEIARLVAAGVEVAP